MEITRNHIHLLALLWLLFGLFLFYSSVTHYMDRMDGGLYILYINPEEIMKSIILSGTMILISIGLFRKPKAVLVEIHMLLIWWIFFCCCISIQDLFYAEEMTYQYVGSHEQI